jgi:hypothetical protein
MLITMDAIYFLFDSRCEYQKRTLPSLNITGSTRIYTRVEVRTLPRGMDALVRDNERVVETGLAVNSKGGDTAVNLDRGGGADESDGRSDEGEHKKKTKRPHDEKETEKLGKLCEPKDKGLKISKTREKDLDW